MEGEREQESIIRQIRSDFRAKQERALNEDGFEGFLGCVEEEIKLGLIPEFSPAEGKLVKEKFEKAGIDLKKLQPAKPEETTEAPTMRAIMGDLRAVFGEGFELKEFVEEELLPLRGKPSTDKKYLEMATANVLRDIVAVARAYQLGEREAAAGSNLRLSLTARVLKGEARKKGFCGNEYHEENIWHIRGLRDLPPGGLAKIGKFLDRLLSLRRESAFVAS